MIKPPQLLPGDTIGIVAPASPPKNPRDISSAIKNLKALGFVVKVGSTVRKRDRYLAGADKARAADINAFFKDPTIDAIVCLRGGYGSQRILPLLDFRAIKRNPKIFCGFSDITALHLAIYKQTGLVTFHGPTVLSGFGKREGEMSTCTLSSFLRATCEKKPYGDIEQGFPRKQYISRVSICDGKAQGRLLGGNLSLLSTLVGTPYLPSLRGSILFLEDLNEPHYKIDRMLTHLLHAGVLQGVKGIALGIWKGCSDGVSKNTHAADRNLIHLFKERLSSLSIPIVYGLAFGHLDDYATLPLGVRASLDARTLTLSIQESAVHSRV